jgi:hypothetical protein
VAARLARSVRVARLGSFVGSRFGHTADPTLDDFVLLLVFLFILLAVSALAPPARNHSAFVSFLFVADLLVFGWLLFFADFFVFIGYLSSGRNMKQNRASSFSHQRRPRYGERGRNGSNEARKNHQGKSFP